MGLSDGVHITRSFANHDSQDLTRFLFSWSTKAGWWATRMCPSMLSRSQLSRCAHEEEESGILKRLMRLKMVSHPALRPNYMVVSDRCTSERIARQTTTCSLSFWENHRATLSWQCFMVSDLPTTPRWIENSISFMQRDRNAAMWDKGKRNESILLRCANRYVSMDPPRLYKIRSLPVALELGTSPGYDCSIMRNWMLTAVDLFLSSCCTCQRTWSEYPWELRRFSDLVHQHSAASLERRDKRAAWREVGVTMATKRLATTSELRGSIISPRHVP